MGALDASWTIDALLAESKLPRREAEVLLCAALGCERAYLMAHASDGVEPQRASVARDWFERRHRGVPVAYLTGRREFYGLSLRVTPDVLIPRPETEILVERALERLPLNSRARVLDLGTGSGAIAIALARERPGLTVLATDLSEAALAVARENARTHGVEVLFLRADWFSGIESTPFDLIVSNPPYVASGDAHLEQGDLRFEPREALAAGEDGMACIRPVAASARGWLARGGWLLLEHGFDQKDRCMELLGRLGYEATQDFDDLAGVPRVCAGRWRKLTDADR